MFRRRRSPVGPILLLVLVAGLAVAGVAAATGLVTIPGVPRLTGSGIPGEPSASPGAGATAVVVMSTPTPKPLTWEEKARETGKQFLDAWSRRDYFAMYGTLSAPAKAAITQEKFVGRYRAIMSGVGIMKVSGQVDAVQLTPSAGDPTQASAAYTVKLESSRAEPVTEQNAIAMVREGDDWKVSWSPELIFKGLVGENTVLVDPQDPVRGRILDRKGRVLAGPGDVLDLGVIPGQVTDEAKVLAGLSALLGVPADEIKTKMSAAQADWWVPLRDFPKSRQAEIQSRIASLAGVGLRDKSLRVYPFGQAAAHVLGYVSRPTADELAKLEAEGYEEEDLVGRAGIEAWADKELAGKKGGRILIMDPQGKIARVVAERQSVPGADVKLTIDIDVQQQAEKALGQQIGSIVAMDPRDNSLLALVSKPGFDPNAFVLGISSADWAKLSGDPNHPFQNRAAASAYPTGSVFKVITMDAGLEKGGFAPTTPFDCNGSWQGLPGVNMGDWKPEGHGHLDLQQGLVESCDIVFYEIGKKLDSMDPKLLPDYARQFGLGEKTGIVGLDDVAGTVPDPNWKQKNQNQEWFGGDTINLAIGQGFLESTPLQMANVYAALANGGELRTPVLVSSVGEGANAKAYKTEVRRRIPGSEATLKSIREAMKKVASTEDGTAYYAFRNFSVPTAAKTGSAENQGPKAHAWFAGYAPADQPEIVIVVMVEGGDMGGEVAAPLGRQVLEGYFAKPRN